ncbi:MAG: flavin reductase family protein [Treponemataceae bacterium]|nr:flavin reductase family protein [Treponemataceae bacterium]
MNKITLPKAARVTSPNPVTLVCTQKMDGGTNLATVSWWTYLSYNPNMIAYAMAKTSFSGEMVRQNKKVVLTVPGEKIAEAVLGCGSTTGRNTDKIEKFGIEMQSLPESEIRVPLHSALAIVCTLKEFTETGDHYLYICNVEQVYADEQEQPLFAWNGYAEIAPAKKAGE